MTQDQQNRTFIEFLQIIQKNKLSHNSHQVQTQYIPSSVVNNINPSSLQHSYYDNYSYPTYQPLNLDLPRSSVTYSSKPPSTTTDMEAYNQSHIPLPPPSLRDQRNRNINMHRHQPYPSSQQSTCSTPTSHTTIGSTNDPNIDIRNSNTFNPYYLQTNSPTAVSIPLPQPTSNNNYSVQN